MNRTDRLVLIEWTDACGGMRQGWKPTADMIGRKPHPCRSVGWIIEDADTHIVLVPHLSNDGDGDGELTIPKGWTQRIVDLVVRPKRRK